MDLRILRLYDTTLISYHGDIESRMLQIRIRKDSNGKCRYDRSYTETTDTKNPDRMSGFFIAQIFINQVYKKLIE